MNLFKEESVTSIRFSNNSSKNMETSTKILMKVLRNLTKTNFIEITLLMTLWTLFTTMRDSLILATMFFINQVLISRCLCKTKMRIFTKKMRSSSGLKRKTNKISSWSMTRQIAIKSTFLKWYLSLITSMKGLIGIHIQILFKRLLNLREILKMCDLISLNAHQS